MSLRNRLRRSLTYSNVMATVAVFIALGGGAYAVTLPRNSVGREQLKRNSVTSAEVKNRSIGRADLRRALFPGGVGATADDTDPSPVSGVTVRRAQIALRRGGKLYVLATLRDMFVTCSAAGSCSSRWGIYVDDRPVPDTAVQLQASAGGSDGFSYYTLFGVTRSRLAPGRHVIRLGRAEVGEVVDVGQLGSQLGAISLGG